MSDARFTPPARQDKTVLSVSCLAWRYKLNGPTSASGGRTAPPDTLRHRPDTERTCLADSVHTATPDTTKQSCLCRVWRGDVNWVIAINAEPLYTAPWSATPCRTTSAHGRTMSPLWAYYNCDTSTIRVRFDYDSSAIQHPTRSYVLSSNNEHVNSFPLL